MKINIFYLLSKISIILISLLCILSILLFYNNAVTLNSLYILISLLIIGSVIQLNKLKKFTRVLFTIIILPILSYLMVNFSYDIVTQKEFFLINQNIITKLKGIIINGKKKRDLHVKCLSIRSKVCFLNHFYSFLK